jgi:glucose/arabinose dehydrogenase
MFTYLSRRGTRPRTTTRLRRITAALAAVTGGLLAWAAAVPAASAATILIPDPGGASGPVPATPAVAPVQVIAAGGMPGWQITLIAVAAALVTATAAVFLDRTRASRRSASAIG